MQDFTKILTSWRSRLDGVPVESPAYEVTLEMDRFLACNAGVTWLTGSDYAEFLRLLIDRANWWDRWLASCRPGHWLNKARREALIYRWEP